MVKTWVIVIILTIVGSTIIIGVIRRHSYTDILCDRKISSEHMDDVETLLTVDRYTQLQQIVSDHLLSSGDTFNELFRFLSLLDDNCSSILVPEAVALRTSMYFKTREEEMLKKVNEATAGGGVEGFSGQSLSQVVFYLLLARQSWVRQVCEIGFNAGHSALYWLAASHKTNLLSFDIGVHAYSKVMADYMRSAYPGRFQIVWGNSNESVPKFAKEAHNSGLMITCDLIIVDGGHDYEEAIADLRNMRAFARSPRHLLVIDDTPCMASWCVGPGKAWQAMRNVVKPLLGCTNYPDTDKGFSVGYYI